MRKFGAIFTFLAGIAVGGAAVWYYTKDKYAQLAEEEINSVKEAYARREKQQESKPETDISPNADSGQTHVVVDKVQDKGDIKEFARRVQGEKGYTNYSKTVVPPKEKPQEEPAQSENSGETPYVISPDEFDELEGYTPISLTYFADGVLSDEHGVIIDDAEEIVGDALNHFGEYEEDSVFVRNDAKRCDYEILRDEHTYEEFRKTLPPNI